MGRHEMRDAGRIAWEPVLRLTPSPTDWARLRGPLAQRLNDDLYREMLDWRLVPLVECAQVQ